MAANDKPVFQYVILYENGVMVGADNRTISHMYDLSDCDYMEGVKAVYAVDQECKLVPVALGEVSKDPDYGESSRSTVWGYSDIMAGTKRVGTVRWTSH